MFNLVAGGNGTHAATINIGTGTGAAHAINIGNSTTNVTTTTIGGNIVTTPVAASVATGAFGNSLTAGTAAQNTTGYDVLLNITVQVASSTTATLTLGVGPTNAPTLETAVPSFTVATAAFFTIFAYVPNNYYVKVSDTGTISITSITVVAMAL
jgi:hypothetical protein